MPMVDDRRVNPRAWDELLRRGPEPAEMYADNLLRAEHSVSCCATSHRSIPALRV